MKNNTDSCKKIAVGVKMSESGNTGEVIKGMGLLELGQDLGSQVMIKALTIFEYYFSLLKCVLK